MASEGLNAASTQPLALHERLPRELLSVIFTCFCKERGARSRTLLLTICREWQSICYSTPALWDEIKIRINRTRFQLFDQSALALPEIARRAKMWLAHSGALPCSLEIFIVCGVPHSGYPSEGPLVFGDLITSVSHRLRKLVMVAPGYEFRVFRELLPAGLPLLNELYFTPTGVLNAEAWALVDATFSQCKSLRSASVNINGSQEPLVYVLSFLNPTIFLPWHQLTTLNYQDRSTPLATFAETFRLCTSLESCELRLSLWELESEAPDAHMPLTTLPHLRVLKMTLSGHHSASFFHAFRMPALTELSIRGERPFDSKSFSLPLLKLHQRHPFPLQRISLAFIALEMNALLALLSRLEHLQELWAERCNCLDEVLVQALTVEPDSARPILPRLNRLDIGDYNIGNTAAKDDTIVRMIKSRWSQKAGVADMARLEEVSLADEHTLAQEFYPELRTMMEDGLYLYLRGFGSDAQQEDWHRT